MFKFSLTFLIQIIIASTLFAQINVQIESPGRLQWENENGYCGSLSVQQLALYFGTYSSQDYCRNVVCNGQEVLFRKNLSKLVENIGLTYEKFNSYQQKPQHEKLFIWMKEQILAKKPVIIGVCMGLGSRYYDHIIPITGIQTQDSTEYVSTDIITFNDNFYLGKIQSTVGSYWDNMYRNKKTECNTKRWVVTGRCYGISITGIRDPLMESKPIRIMLYQTSEPNTRLELNPTIFELKVHEFDLQPGKTYAVLRYDSYEKIPSKGFSIENADAFRKFKASDTIHMITDYVMSDKFAAYRCIELNDPETIPVIQKNLDLTVNRFKKNLAIKTNELGLTLEIKNNDNKIILTQELKDENTRVKLSSLEAGKYTFIIVQNGQNILMDYFTKDK